MTPYERLKSMVEGREVDRPGISTWKHFFLDDRYVIDHVRRVTAFQDMCQWDFIKIMTTNVHMEAAYGAKVKWSASEGDRTLTVNKPMKSPKQIGEMTPCDVTVGPIGKEVEVAKRLVDIYKGKVPVIATIDTPASYLKALYCGFEDPQRFVELVRSYPDEFKHGLDTMLEVTKACVDEYRKVGVDGIFFATNVCNEIYFTEEEYAEIILPYDKALIEYAADKAWFNILHIHGDGRIPFKLLADNLPVQAINWHSVTSNVSIEEAAKLTDKILIAGLDHMKDFAFAERGELVKRLDERIDSAMKNSPHERFILATGCSVIPPSIPDARLCVLHDEFSKYLDLQAE